ETWVKLPDGSILTYDNATSNDLTIKTGQTQFFAERYIPANTTAAHLLGESNVWIDASGIDRSNPPGPLSEGSGASEIGNALPPPDGPVFFLGNNGGNTAFYDTATGLWSAGPTVQNSRGFGDVPAVMMPNGHVLLTSYDGNPQVLSFHLLEFDP